MVAVIVWLSLTPAPPTIDFRESDKVGHFLAYGGVMFWFSQLYQRTPVRVAYGISFVAMGIALELAQRALGYRTYEVFDMFANTLGVLIGWALALAIRKPLLV
jgi:VanZ family protein